MDSVLNCYEGSENYIFISYAHKDTDKVLPVLQRLQDSGYRFWYDDAISPASEWPETIADHLTRASAVIAFISPASVASRNCKREIIFALDQNIPFIYILVEPTELTSGLKLQLAAQNYIKMESNGVSDRFMMKLQSVEILSSCKVEEVPIQAVDKKTTNVSVQEFVKTTQVSIKSSSEHTNENKTSEVNEKTEPKNKSKLPVILIPICVILLVVLVLIGKGVLSKSNEDSKSDSKPVTEPSTVVDSSPTTEATTVPATETASEPDPEIASEPVSKVASESVSELDKLLLGSWYVYGWDNNGESPDLHLALDRMDSVIILPDGTVGFRGNSFPDILEAVKSGSYKISEETNNKSLFENLTDYILSANVSYSDKLKNYSNLSCTYTITDVVSSDVHYGLYYQIQKDYLDSCTTDCLEIHLTGNYNENALTTKKVDITYYLFRNINNVEEYLQGFLFGTWKDNTGGQWSFNYDEDTGFSYTYTTSDGTLYNSRGDSIYITYGYDLPSECFEDYGAAVTIQFHFDGFSSSRYSIASLNFDRIAMSDSDGNTLELSR